MTDEQKNDHWSELVNQVGASPPADWGKKDDQPADSGEAEREEKVFLGGEEEADSEQIPSEAEAETAIDAPAPKELEVAPRTVRSYRPKSGWDDLAQEFKVRRGWGGHLDLQYGFALCGGEQSVFYGRD